MRMPAGQRFIDRMRGRCLLDEKQNIEVTVGGGIAPKRWCKSRTIGLPAGVDVRPGIHPPPTTLLKDFSGATA